MKISCRSLLCLKSCSDFPVLEAETPFIWSSFSLLPPLLSPAGSLLIIYSDIQGFLVVNHRNHFWLIEADEFINQYWAAQKLSGKARELSLETTQPGMTPQHTLASRPRKTPLVLWLGCRLDAPRSNVTAAGSPWQELPPPPPPVLTEQAPHSYCSSTSFRFRVWG